MDTACAAYRTHADGKLPKGIGDEENQAGGGMLTPSS
ncbi:hypothetical protein PF005_g29389 [Phytophthora fragariae]|uniref:Uncharacterized protein n=2 Tax=Phytophthora TaxID=4783 RepID=A0A6A3QAH8_9STRA|nr:hypothetical protein PF009_g29866 [Phytophthora fragariae]KAE8986609.1 hypothetical protein PR002_g22305 [Phytophthora rubi]KAE8965118.1 hypothetical protein PF011_g28427 [Phytophthora fragariae]KAE8992804.1 hypothetical protein PR001_g20847 [Phytophthora rubi]KAE9062769.1 hypothetical protein PF010_g29266 [Phytophthora fragariae]